MLGSRFQLYGVPVTRIFVARASRSLAYGALAVVLAQALASRGRSPAEIGALVTVALLSGAVWSACSGALVRKFGAATTLAANLLAAASYLLDDRVAARIGLLRTMVFTHLPSNVLLCLIPLMPTLPLAAAVLLARFALSQMDVPTRQAFTFALVPPHERARAAGLAAAVRPAAASVAPLLTGLAFQFAALGLPFGRSAREFGNGRR